tara:strand:+ start:14 stop:451 length:438 start_codon:yes stop_codon:yes gene_type:complete
MKIIYETPEGGVAVVTPVSDKPIETIAAKTVPSGTAYTIIDESIIPSNRRFRNAWQKSGSTIVVDVTKAKDIACADLRTSALQIIEKCQEKTELGEAVTYTKQVLQAAYQSALANLKSKQTVAEMETCLDQFTTTYTLEESAGGY